jgi:hypothetical protein
VLFILSLIFGILWNHEASLNVMLITFTGIAASLALIYIESKFYPDTVSIEEDKNEDRNLIDRPYSCFFNPILPAVGITMSGITVGFIE